MSDFSKALETCMQISDAALWDPESADAKEYVRSLEMVRAAMEKADAAAEYPSDENGRKVLLMEQSLLKAYAGDREKILAVVSNYVTYLMSVRDRLPMHSSTYMENVKVLKGILSRAKEINE